MKKVVLQVALDLLELKRALQIAQEAIDGGADWIEVGTPLIKSEGMSSIRAMRDRFPDSVIVADMKIADTGTLEVEMAVYSRMQMMRLLKRQFGLPGFMGSD
jgi:3-hexulose-6-phosphate synthase/6-phospho-3-hexuloisomerase